jgi:hypothetical protein
MGDKSIKARRLLRVSMTPILYPQMNITMKFKIKTLMYTIRLTILLIPIFCLGCTTNPVQKVLLPVPTNNTKIPISPKPYLPIYNLKSNSKPGEVMKAYVVTVKLLNDDDEQLRDIIDAYQ